MSQRLDWARAHKEDFVRLQKQTGIPALWTAAQHLHEAFNRDGTLSDLAADHGNFAGVKWAEWQRQFGCTPVVYATTEYVGGRSVTINDAFCSCPDFATWLQVYAHLLTQELYQPAMQFAADPMLFGARVWEAGYATDPHYLVGRDTDGNATGVYVWLRVLWDDYKDTLSGSAPVHTRPIRVGKVTITGTVDATGTTWAKVRELTDALAANTAQVVYDPVTDSVTIS